MRNSFRAYYRPTDNEIAEIWHDGVIVLDTNTLLNFFRYTPSTRDEFLGVLEKLHASLWIPHHVGLEFHRRRLTVISTTSDAFTKVAESLTKAKKDIAGALNEYKHHPSINRTELLEEVGGFLDGLTTKLAKQATEHQARVVGSGDAEQTFQRISDLFSGHVGTAFTEAELAAIYEEGKRRYEDKTPPGFKDKDDSNPNQYGDLVIWKEILKLGADRKQPVIFVTDDAKEDWWWKHGGETQGPRVELIDEYWASAERRIHFYEPLRFLQYAKEQTNTSISRESLEEVEEVSNANSRAQRVLRERRQQLEAQQANFTRRIERAHRERHSASPSAELRSELDALAAQERALQSHIHILQGQLTETPKGYQPDTPESEANFYPRSHARREEVESIGRHLATIRRQRDLLEKKLRLGEGSEDRLEQMWQERLLANQAELVEVNLALDELTED